MTATAVEEEIGHIYSLLLLRDLFADCGVAGDELRGYDAAIAKARERLVQAARTRSAPLAA